VMSIWASGEYLYTPGNERKTMRGNRYTVKLTPLSFAECTLDDDDDGFTPSYDVDLSDTCELPLGPLLWATTAEERKGRWITESRT
jgi:hypothetical protein